MPKGEWKFEKADHESVDDSVNYTVDGKEVGHVQINRTSGTLIFIPSVWIDDSTLLHLGPIWGTKTLSEAIKLVEDYRPDAS